MPKLKTVLEPIWALTMRSSGARLRCRQTNLFYPDHQLPPWLPKTLARDRAKSSLCDLKRYSLGTICHPLSPLLLETKLLVKQS